MIKLKFSSKWGRYFYVVNIKTWSDSTFQWRNLLSIIKFSFPLYTQEMAMNVRNQYLPMKTCFHQGNFEVPMESSDNLTSHLHFITLYTSVHVYDCSVRVIGLKIGFSYTIHCFWNNFLRQTGSEIFLLNRLIYTTSNSF